MPSNETMIRQAALTARAINLARGAVEAAYPDIPTPVGMIRTAISALGRAGYLKEPTHLAGPRYQRRFAGQITDPNSARLYYILDTEEGRPITHPAAPETPLVFTGRALADLEIIRLNAAAAGDS